MKKKAAPKKAATKKAAKQIPSELLALQVPGILIQGIEAAGVTNREEYINFLIASSLLNYPQIWKNENLEKEIRKIKDKSDSQNYMR
jgi:hypothetical protein